MELIVNTTISPPLFRDAAIAHMYAITIICTLVGARALEEKQTSTTISTKTPNSKHNLTKTHNLKLKLRLISDLRPTLVIETYSRCHPVSTAAAEKPSLRSDAKVLRQSIILHQWQ